MTSNSHLFTAVNLDTAEVLINLLAEYNLTQALLQGIIMLEVSNTKNHTRPDNVFCSVGLEIEHTFTQCAVEYQLHPIITDHFPIISTIDLQPECINPSLQSNFRDVDWKEFREALSTHLDTSLPPADIQTIDQFQQTFTHLTQAIAKTVEEHIPKSKQSPYQKQVHKLGWKARDRLARRQDPIHEEFCIACNRFSENIKKAKTEHWEEWLKALTPTNIWDFHRYAASDPTNQVHMRIKTLQDPQDLGGNNIM
ncbi:hypothetical protein F4604DRAFT_1584861 [Suillus subluteus]|nr:hypothetical protein F4604DRAFT_1584861 [Suillus subluteus]